jgi:hypothetical protein
MDFVQGSGRDHITTWGFSLYDRLTYLHILTYAIQ